MQKIDAVTPGFLSGGGDMGHLMRSKDWSSTQLGSPDNWPQSLRSTISLILHSRYPMFIWWSSDLLMFHNDAYLPVLGKKHPEALGSRADQTWSEIWDQIGPFAADVLKGKNFFAEDMRLYLHRKGYLEETYWTFSYSPIFNEDGNVDGLFCACNEETKKILRQRRLEVLKGISEIATDSADYTEVCRKSVDILAANPYDIPFSALYLWDESTSTATLVNKSNLADLNCLPPLLTVGHPAFHGCWNIQNVLETHEPELIKNLSEVLPEFDGHFTVVPEMALVQPLQNSGQDRPIGILICGISGSLDFDDEYRSFYELAARQISNGISRAAAYEEKHKRAEALAELDRAKTAFFTNVSHEFRTPLTLMMAPLEEAIEAAEKTAASEKELERLKLLYRNTLRLYKLVNTLLDFSRLEAGRIKAFYRPVEIASLTSDISGLFRSAIHNVGMELNIRCQPLSEPVYVDVEMWEKIVLNLMSNAFKFTLEGSITVEMTERSNVVTLRVADTGVGIPEKELPRIFERFHRVKNLSGRTHEGTGIGLSLVKELVALHNGTVDVASKEGEGTVFTISIPKGKAHLPAEKIMEPVPDVNVNHLGARSYLEELLYKQPAQDYEKKEFVLPEIDTGKSNYILVADDNSDMRNYIQRLLSDKYSVKTVSNGQIAMEAVREKRPDLIICDIMMPVMDGIEFLNILRKDESYRLIPVILVSARAGVEAMEEGLNHGADDYLVKPFSAREFKSRVAAILRFNNMRQEAERLVKESEERLRLALKSANMGTWHYDPIQDKGTTSKRVSELTGFEPGTGFRHYMGLGMVVDEHKGKLEEAFKKALDPASGGFIDIDYDIINQFSKQRRTIRVVGQAFYNEDGLAYRVSGMVQDITEKRRNKLELEKKIQELERFAYVASHDLQEPLNTIKSVVGLIENDLPRESKAKEYITFIKASSNRMTALINDLLEHSRIGVKSNLELVDFNEIINNLISDLDTVIRKNRVQIKCSKLPVMKAYRTEIRLLFQNLISNAIKFNRDGIDPVIEIAAKPLNGAWQFSVSDNGIGIEEKYLNQIFTIFQRLHTKEEFEGTGIGLAHCKKIVELHNGRIWVTSAIEEGSTFHFIIAEPL